MSVPEGIDASVPNAARMYDYYLGGKDNFAADREAAEAVLAVAPEMRMVARAGRTLIKQVVTHLVRDCGIRQILDLGSGLPAGENVHEIARAIDPDVRVVYVDYDEVVCIHGRALLCDPSRAAMIHRDVREPKSVLEDPETRQLIDFSQPVGVLMMFLLHLIPDSDDPNDFVAEYRDALVPGSYLAVSHAASDADPAYTARIASIYERANAPFSPRTKPEIARFFGDWDLRASSPVNDLPFPTSPGGLDPKMAETGYVGVARKP